MQFCGVGPALRVWFLESSQNCMDNDGWNVVVQQPQARTTGTATSGQG